MTDDEIEAMAEDWASRMVPKPSHSLSINKWDMRAGFIAGLKKGLEIAFLENEQETKTP
jgi:hypothetical protein